VLSSNQKPNHIPDGSYCSSAQHIKYLMKFKKAKLFSAQKCRINMIPRPYKPFKLAFLQQCHDFILMIFFVIKSIYENFKTGLLEKNSTLLQ
jgi:hypothetical protein